MEPIPLDIVAGWKHAGKTTLINTLLKGPYRGQAVSVFSNEAGDTPYAPGSTVHTVLGGCVCCTAQTELVAKIRNALWFDGPDHLILELSGQGDIRDILQIFSYLPDCTLYQLVYVLDARKFQAMAAVLGSRFPEQIRCAPVVLLNHWAGLPPETQDAVRAQLLQWNPGVRLLTGPEALDPTASHALCRAAVPLSGGGPPHPAPRSRTRQTSAFPPLRPFPPDGERD